MTFKADHKIYTCEGVKIVNDNNKWLTRLMVVALAALSIAALVYTVIR